MPVELTEHAPAILEWRGALSRAQCEAIIAAFEAEPRVRAGVVRRPDGSEVVDAGLKRSTDFLIEPDSGEGWLALDAQLVQAMRQGVEAYFERFPWLPKLPTTFCGFQVQRTEVGEGFDWHADEDGRRRLALIFYLNEDFEGGGTEFRTQGVTVRPRQGSLVMFPPYWTHVHRGQPVTGGRKYIVTCFLMREREPSAPGAGG